MKNLPVILAWLEWLNIFIVIIVNIVFFVVWMRYRAEQKRYEDLYKPKEKEEPYDWGSEEARQNYLIMYDLENEVEEEEEVVVHDEDYILKYSDKLAEIHLYITRLIILQVYFIFMLVEFNFYCCQSKVHWWILLITCLLFIVLFLFVLCTDMAIKKFLIEFHEYFFVLLLLIAFVIILFLHALFIAKWDIIYGLYATIIWAFNVIKFTVLWIPKTWINARDASIKEKENARILQEEREERCKNWVKENAYVFEHDWEIFSRLNTTKYFWQSWDEEDEKLKMYFKKKWQEYLIDKFWRVVRKQEKEIHVIYMSQDFFQTVVKKEINEWHKKNKK